MRQVRPCYYEENHQNLGLQMPLLRHVLWVNLTTHIDFQS